MKRAWTPVNDMQKKPVQLVKPYPLVIGRAECSSNLWGYLCERYEVNPSDTVQLALMSRPDWRRYTGRHPAEHSENKTKRCRLTPGSAHPKASRSIAQTDHASIVTEGAWCVNHRRFRARMRPRNRY